MDGRRSRSSKRLRLSWATSLIPALWRRTSFPTTFTGTTSALLLRHNRVYRQLGLSVLVGACPGISWESLPTRGRKRATVSRGRRVWQNTCTSPVHMVVTLVRVLD